jgi:hypothetical protein
MRTKHIIGDFEDFFERGQNSQGPLEKPREKSAGYVSLHTKITSQAIRISGSIVF